MIVLHLIVICLLLTNIRSIQLYPMPRISYSKILCLVHLRYSLFPANTILKMLLVTQFAYFASLQKPPFEEFSCVLLFLLRLWRLLLVADNQCTEGSLIPGDQGYYIPHPLPYPGYPSTTGHTTLLHTPGLHCVIYTWAPIHKNSSLQTKPPNQIFYMCFVHFL